MWIATNRGFLSAVTADPARLPKADRKRIGKDTALCIRARNADHLRDLFPGLKVYEWPGRDYPARVFVGAGDFAFLVAELVAKIDYGNFKDSVADNELHDAYMGVWSVMLRYQHGSYARRAYDPLQPTFGWSQYHRADGPPRLPDGRPFNEQVLDDSPFDDGEPCTMPGCTDDYPCVNCLIDAIHGPDNRSEAELLDAAEDKYRAQMDDGDRYGPYDSGDEADDDDTAESHRRVAP